MTDYYLDNYTTYVVEPLTQDKQSVSFVRSSDGSIRLARRSQNQSSNNQYRAQTPTFFIQNAYEEQPVERGSTVPVRRSQSASHTVITQSNFTPRPNYYDSNSNSYDTNTNVTTLGLRTAAFNYMNAQENILAALKETMAEFKKLDQELEDGIEILQDNLKRAQSDIDKQMRDKRKLLKEHGEVRKLKLQEQLENIKEEIRDMKEDFFKNQAKTINQYKKQMGRILQDEE